jgi:hypothetical protein
MVDDAVHGRDCKHRHGEHAQAIDALALFFDERLSGHTPDDSCGEGATADDQQKSEAERKRGGERGSDVEVCKKARCQVALSRSTQ